MLNGINNSRQQMGFGVRLNVELRYGLKDNKNICNFVRRNTGREVKSGILYPSNPKQSPVAILTTTHDEARQVNDDLRRLELLTGDAFESGKQEVLGKGDHPEFGFFDDPIGTVCDFLVAHLNAGT